MKNKILIKAAFILAFIFPAIAMALPNQNQIKFWIGHEKILVEKSSGFFSKDKYEEIDVSKIENLNILQEDTKNGAVNSITTFVAKFSYNYKNKKIPCNASITYSWITAKGPIGDNTLETTILHCGDEL